MSENRYKQRTPRKRVVDPELPVRWRELWKIYAVRITELNSDAFRMLMMIDYLAGNKNCIQVNEIYDLGQISGTRSEVIHTFRILQKYRMVVTVSSYTEQYIKDFICVHCRAYKTQACKERKKNVFLNKDHREWKVPERHPSKKKWFDLITENRPTLLESDAQKKWRDYGLKRLYKLIRNRQENDNEIDKDIFANFLSEEMDMDVDIEDINI